MNLSLEKKSILKLLESIDLNKKILEVGPLQMPLFNKNEADIYYADIYSDIELEKRFSMENCVPIDYVIQEGYEKTFKGKNINFDYILLNNVLEHIPNPIKTLLDMSKILNKNGKIGLLLPDREFSIDYYRQNTSFTDWFDVYIRGEKNNSPRLALDFKLNYINDRNARNFWNTKIKKYPNQNVKDCLKIYFSMIEDFENNYFDEHYWAFTDRSFLKIIEDLLKLNIFPFKIYDFFPTAYNDNVFGVLLEMDNDLLYNDEKRFDQIDEIRNMITVIEEKHFQINASELIRENNKLKELLKYYSSLNPTICSAEEFFKNLNTLKKTARGVDGYLFLVNDGNSELQQHFDKNYQTINFNPKQFIKYFKIKEKIFKSKNMLPYFFIVPDKSVVCKDFLPFNSDNFFRRNYDYFKELFPDFVNELNYNDYFKYDTHMNSSGGRKLAFKILSYIDPSFTLNQYNNMLQEYNYVDRPLYDLVSDDNWSYSKDELNNYEYSKYSSISHYSLTDMSEFIPKTFKRSRNRLSSHYKNLNGLTDWKVLIFHDSSIESLQNFLIPYFNESFFYWDHLELNKDLIQWYKPDIVIEIRIERFLENYHFPDWILNNEKL